MRAYRNLPHRGSHLPVLMKLLPMTTGSVLELGAGVYSTSFFHWACYAQRRRLLTYEDNPVFYRFARQFHKGLHEVRCIRSWDDADYAEPWGLAFVDHGQERRRWLDISRLTHAEYVVAHDAENSAAHKYHYERIHSQFRFRFKYNGAWPYTAVFSNVHDVSKLVI